MTWRRATPYVTVVVALTCVAVARTETPAIDLQLPGDQHARADYLRTAATHAVTTFAGWLGPLPDERLTIHVVPATMAAVAPGANTIRVPQPWVVLRGDRAAERFIIAGLARRYWFDGVRVAEAEAWLAGALARYSAVRVMTEMVESDHYAAATFFGGTVVFPVRFAPLASDAWESRPPPPSFAEIDAVLDGIQGAGTPQAMRGARAFQTLERHIGRPALDSAISVVARRVRQRAAPLTVASVTGIIEEIVGRELTWFFGPAFDPARRYDYAVASIWSQAQAGDQFASRVEVQRLGDAVFSGTSREPVGGYEQGRAMAVRVRLADGTELIEHWDGRNQSRTFEFLTRSPLEDVTIDPDAVLLLDENWQNNSRNTRPHDRSAALQWSALWMAWLQQLMLSATAFV